MHFGSGYTFAKICKSLNFNIFATSLPRYFNTAFFLLLLKIHQHYSYEKDLFLLLPFALLFGQCKTG